MTKGTVVEHSAYCSSAKAHAPRFLIDNTSRVLQFAAHTFDSSLIESLTPLMHGACVCIPSEEQRLNAIVSAMNEMQVNLAFLTPSFIDVIEPSAVPGLETLVLAGEAMSESHVAAWSKINLINGYGPTESSVVAVANTKVTPDADPKDIGFPVGVHCWVVNPDDHDRLVPPGCTGELLLEGPTLARGYSNSPDKTKESFIYDPIWSQGPNSYSRRFYKTGDLVRYNSPEGSLNYVGRKDTQVKFHGQRIELGEVETHVNADPITKHALVLFPKVGYCKGRLVSVFSLSEQLEHVPIYDPTPLKLVEHPGKHSYLEGVRKRIAERIPAYMVPSVWFCVESLPLLTSGKLDRKTVAKWVDETSEEVSRQIPVAVESGGYSNETVTEAEEKLRQVWSRVLNISVVKMSLSHSFLSAGGDSITAMTCVGLCKSIGLGFTVQEVLRSKSIKELAKLAKDVTGGVDYQEDVDKDFDLSPIQQFHFQKREEGKGHFNQSFFLRLSRRIEEEDLRRAIDAVVDRHSMLRARFSLTGPSGQWKQRITTDISSSCRFRSHKVCTPEETDPEIANSQTVLDAIHGPVLTVDLFDLNGEKQLLSMIAHHLVVDLVSWRVILEDLEELLLNPTKPSLAPKSLPFQTWQNMQHENAQKLSVLDVMPLDDIPAGDFSYWGMVNQPNTYGDASCTGFEIDAATTSLLTTECNARLCTETVDILISVLLQSFGQIFTDRSIPAIHNEGHGREPWDEAIDIARTVGWFTTIYPVYVPDLGSDGLVDVVKRVRDIRRRVPAKGRPYFASRFYTKQGKEQFGHHSRMEMTFNYLGQYQQLEREGALLQPVSEMAGEAREAGRTADFGQSTSRFALFEISAVIVQGKLRFSFTFNRYMKHQAAARQWISRCESALRHLADEVVSMTPITATNDFPLLSLSDADLQVLIDEKLPQIGVSSLVDVDDAYPCTPMQRGILLSRAKDKALYSVQCTYEVKSKHYASVDVEALTSAWKLVVHRHQALRTVFVEGLTSEDIYGQVVLKDIDAEPVHLRCSSDNNLLNVLDSQDEPDYGNHRPPHRFTICQTSSGKVFCRLEISHAIMDGASISAIFHDLQLAYAGTLGEGPGPLYSDFVAYLHKRSPDAGLPFWKSYLKEIELTHFPVLNDGISGEKHLRRLRLEYGGLRALQEFCDTNGLTLPNAIHTAWGLTLRCYTDAEDVCFGYLSSERDSPVAGVDATVGPLINMLVCRVKVSADIRLLQVLEQVQKDLMDSLPYKHTSLADVQHALGLSETPLFNTCISYRKLPRTSPSEELVIEFSEHCPIHDPAEYPISVNVEATDSEAAIDLGYWTDSISDGQATNVANTFMRFLDNIAHNSEQRVGQLDYLSDRDCEQICTWNSNIPEIIHDCVPRVIEKQVKECPSALAVHAWDGQFSYRQLNDVARLLGHYLVAHGVGPETIVPVCFDQSAFTIISMLAVLKAGGACVPLNITLPKSTIETRVSEYGAWIILTSPERASDFEDRVRYVVPVNRDLLDQLPDYSYSPCLDVGPSNASFLMFASGSTSRPRGVVLEHHAMVTSAEAHGSALGVVPQTRFLQHGPHSIEMSVQEIFTTLQHGGCVCVPSENDISNNLAGTINDLDVNFLGLTPTVALSLQPSDVPKVKDMAVRGGVMTKKVQEIWGDAVVLHGLYEPSECPIVAIHNSTPGATEDTSNIGRSVGSVSWVVDPTDHHRLVPVGCVGELLIEGPILARGYLDEESTSKYFIEAPVWASKDPNARSSPSRRMYKTGDLVRYNSDGSMVYFGRKDTQVKLNGQRMDLGQVEDCIRPNLPGNAQSAAQVVTIGDTKYLAAFLCLQSDTSVTATSTDDVILPMSSSVRSVTQSLEAAISATIPSYMVPSIYIPVSKIPLTSSGKIDRRAVATLTQTMTVETVATYKPIGSGDKAPSTEAEIVLRQLWSKILAKAVDAIGTDDNFFRHGGDSIGAIKLVAAARSKGIPLTVADIFQRPKLSEMAAHASGASQPPSGRSSQSTSVSKNQKIEPFALLPKDISLDDLIHEVSYLCQVGPDLIQDIYPCTSMQGGLIALSSKTPGAYVAQATFKLPSDVDLDRFRKAWQAVADSEVVLRTRVIFTEELGFLQVVVKVPIEWESARSLEDIGDESSRIPSHDGGELGRYTLVGDGSHAPQFVWTVHHALYDGWSMPTLLNRVVACYRSHCPTAPTVETSFPHFIEYLSSIDLRESDEFWKSRLQGSTAIHFPRLPNSRYQAQPTSKLTKSVPVPAFSVRDTTLASVIRASWALIVSLYSYSDDVVFGEIMNGRDAPVTGIGGMIGPTLTTVPTRVRIDHDLTIAEYLRVVQDQMAQVLPFQFAGIQNIKRLGSEAAVACEFQNCLSISQDADVSPDGFWNMSTSFMDGTNFYTYPLAMSCTVHQETVNLEANYDPTLISTWQMEKLFCQFEITIRRLASNGATKVKIRDISLISAQDLEAIEDVNRDRLRTADRFVHDIVHDYALSNPKSQAICSWDATFTYGELDDLSSTLAHHLMELGVGSNPQTLVPLCFEKSAFAVVSVLAVLKAGGAFVPFDARHRISRLQEMANNICAHLALCSPKQQQLCESIVPNTLIVDLDLLKSLPSFHYPTPDMTTSNAVYIIFSSGTSGKPKETRGLFYDSLSNEYLIVLTRSFS